MMISILAIFIALTTSAPAKGSIECNFADPHPQTVCSGASGQHLVFYLPKTDVRLTKDKYGLILSGGAISKEYAPELRLFANGTLILGVARREHSGEYMMQQHGADGALVRSVKIRLEIQELHGTSGPTVDGTNVGSSLSTVLIVTVGSVTFILVVVVCLFKIYRQHTPRPATVTAGIRNDPSRFPVSICTENTEEEVVYSAVRIKPRATQTTRIGMQH